MPRVGSLEELGDDDYELVEVGGGVIQDGPNVIAKTLIFSCFKMETAYRWSSAELYGSHVGSLKQLSDDEAGSGCEW